MIRRDERGSAAIEAAIGVPAFALFVGLIIFGGRTATTHEALQSAAADAARSASLARDADVARADAREAATASITNQKIGCSAVDVAVDTSDFNKQPGRPRLGERDCVLPPRPVRSGRARSPRIPRHASDHVQPDRHLAGTMSRRDERGSVTVWLALSSFVMIFLVGLAVDLGGQVHAHERAHDVAAQAARAGGEEVEGGSAIQGHDLAISPAAARTAAQRYLEAAGVTGTVAITDGTTITVTVNDSYDPQFLGLIGINRLDVTGTATARLVRTLGGSEQ